MRAAILTQYLSRKRLVFLLNLLDTRAKDESLSLYLGPGMSADSIRNSYDVHSQWFDEINKLVTRYSANSNTGTVVFWSHHVKLMIIPPFAIYPTHRTMGIDTVPLRTLMDMQMTIAVILLRLGRYAVGVFKDETLVDFKTDSRYVKGRHSAGGTSQGRFARIREKQIHQLFVKACSVSEEKLVPYESKIDHVFLGGERHVLNSFAKSCPLLRRIEPRIAKRLLAVKEPNLQELKKMIYEVWKSKIFVFGLPDGFYFNDLHLFNRQVL